VASILTTYVTKVAFTIENSLTDMIFILAAFKGYLVLASFKLDIHDLRFDISLTFGSTYHNRKHEDVCQIQFQDTGKIWKYAIALCRLLRIYEVPRKRKDHHPAKQSRKA
jgi:hypothetical protein